MKDDVDDAVDHAGGGEREEKGEGGGGEGWCDMDDIQDEPNRE